MVIDYENHTALSCSALYGLERCVNLLIDAGADVNVKTQFGTALHAAAREGEGWSHAAKRAAPACIELLIQAGADVNHTSQCGTVLDTAPREDVGWSYAVKRKRSAAAACIGLLIQAGADVNTMNSHNETALMLAAFANHRDGVKVLLQEGAEVRLTHVTGFNTLSLYVVKNTLCQVSVVHKGMIKLLHAAGETNGVNEGQIERLDGDCHRTNITNKDFMEIASQDLSDDDPDLCLKDICRRTIREHLLQMSRINLFLRVPHLGLPSLLAEYLLYDVSLE